MAQMNQIVNENLKPANKWLYIVLFFTLITTAWTALHGDGANEDNSAELEIKKSSNESQQSFRSSSNVDHFDQRSVIKKSEETIDKPLIPWSKLKRVPIESKLNDVFKVHSWVIVPPVRKPPPPPPPPPPQAPAAPFVYVGKLENSPKGTQVFLMLNNKLLSVVMGEKINQQWKLDGEDAGVIHLTYIPLDLKQVLSKSAKQVVSTAIEVNQ